MVRRAHKGTMKSEEMTSQLEDSLAGKDGGVGPDCSREGGYDWANTMINPHCGECKTRIGISDFSGSNDCVHLTMFNGDYCTENRQNVGLVDPNEKNSGRLGTYDDYDEDLELKSYGLVLRDFLNTETTVWCVHWYSEPEQKGELLDLQCCRLNKNHLNHVGGDEGERCAFRANSNTYRKKFTTARKPCCTKYTTSLLMWNPFGSTRRFSWGSEEMRRY